MRFVCDSGYMPVLKESNDVSKLDSLIQDEGLEVSDKAYSCLTTVMSDFDDTKFYTPKAFENGYSARKILDYNLSDKAAADKEAIDAAVAGGISREEAVKPYITDEAFDAWYESFCNALKEAVGQ